MFRASIWSTGASIRNCPCSPTAAAAFVNKQGVPTIISEKEGIQVAVAKDDNLDQWEVVRANRG